MKRFLPWIFVPFGLIVSQSQPAQTQVDVGQISIKINTVPSQTVTVVNATTPNSFPIPQGRTVCIVTRNIAQSPGIDYNVTNGAIIFTQVPSLGDVVQLNCF